MAVISTWVGFEVGLIQEAMARLGDGGQAYTFFLQSIPYSYYPLLTLLFVYLTAFTQRDFGSMLAAERRAFEKGQVLRPGARPASEAPTPDDELAPYALSVEFVDVLTDEGFAKLEQTAPHHVKNERRHVFEHLDDIFRRRGLLVE